MNIAETPLDKIKDGSVRIHKNNSNYYYFKRISPGKWTELHKLNWIEKFGPVPEGMVLACRTGDTLNPDPENWEMISNEENINRTVYRTKNPERITVIICHHCGKSFTTISSKRRVCDSCLKPKPVRYKKKCAICSTPFETSKKRQLYCSTLCGQKAYRIRIKATSTKKTIKKKSSYLRKKSSNDRRIEAVPVEDMKELNWNNPKNDSEILKRKGISSPDISEMKFRYYDPKLKITRFFRSKEKYEKFKKNHLK